ncbi:MAG: hypothetical protein AAGA56_04630 [Myxococcota bacterium]
MHSTHLVTVYGTYAFLSAVLTIALARVLSRSGAVFLRDVFPDKPELADAVNRLLVVGFYLVNGGYALLLLEGGYAPTVVAAIETLSSKLGWLLLSLALMHFFNLGVFHRLRRRSLEPAPHPYRSAMRESERAAPAASV